MVNNALDLCSLAWGNQDGYVCISERNQDLTPQDQGYWIDEFYEWPGEREKVGKVLQKARSSETDMYWAPAVFSEPKRRKGLALPTDSLWGDLDHVDPTKLPADLKPAAYWQTSPDRWQAIWKLPEVMEPDQQQAVNQALTYEIGADKGGWDLPQVLRIPGTFNHKYQDVKVELQQLNGKRVRLTRIAELIQKGVPHEGNVLDTGTDRPRPTVDTRSTLRTKPISPKTRRLLRTPRSRVHMGERSERLWELECGLAEAGWTTDEIVSAVRGSAWNKFAGRADELQRLTTEALKSQEHVSRPPPALSRSVTTQDSAIVDDDENLKPVTWREFDRDHAAITWVVDQVWGTSEVGFVSGAPKSYKSWVAVDLAVSLATGTKFLGEFKSTQTRTLLIQEEDPRTVLQDRLVKVAGSKEYVWAKIKSPDIIRMRYDLPDDLFIISNQGFTITNEDHLTQLEDFILDNEIGFVIMDPLMMIAGGTFDEFKAFEVMENVLKPLKQIRARTASAITLVHHHTKSSGQGNARDMYGSVAFWAWEEAALHMNASTPGTVSIERFSKHSQLVPMTLSVGDTSAGWEPRVTLGATGKVGILDTLSQYPDGVTVAQLSGLMGTNKDVTLRELSDLHDTGKVESKPAPHEPGKRGRRGNVWVGAE